MCNEQQVKEYEEAIEENKRATRQLRECLMLKFAYFEEFIRETEPDSAVESAS